MLFDFQRGQKPLIQLYSCRLLAAFNGANTCTIISQVNILNLQICSCEARLKATKWMNIDVYIKLCWLIINTNALPHSPQSHTFQGGISKYLWTVCCIPFTVKQFWTCYISTIGNVSVCESDIILTATASPSFDTTNKGWTEIMNVWSFWQQAPLWRTLNCALVLIYVSRIKLVTSHSLEKFDVLLLSQKVIHFKVTYLNHR